MVSKEIYDNNGKYNRLTMNNVKHVPVGRLNF